MWPSQGRAKENDNGTRNRRRACDARGAVRARLGHHGLWRCAVHMDALAHLTRYPIVQLKPHWYALENLKGKRLSYHRTVSGALRARREIIEGEHDDATQGMDAASAG